MTLLFKKLFRYFFHKIFRFNDNLNNESNLEKCTDFYEHIYTPIRKNQYKNLIVFGLNYLKNVLIFLYNNRKRRNNYVKNK